MDKNRAKNQTKDQTKNQTKQQDTYTERELKELMGVNRQTYTRRNGAIVRKGR